jgi:uncharacterized protein involved in propanediol utilization
MRSSVKIFARIGELIQGILPDRSPFLVSGLPSRVFFSEASLEDNARHSATGAWSPGSHFPPASAAAAVLPPKARQALELFRSALPAGRSSSGIFRPASGHTRPLPLIHLHSNIPSGKGLSSSSADILSVLYLANDYYGAGFTNSELYTLAARVEPTDPCLSDDIVVFKQQAGVTERSLSLPPLTMLYFDAAPDRQINTVDVRRHYDQQASGFFQSLLYRFLQAAEYNNYAALFDCITHSALYNHSVISLPRFEEYHRLAIHAQAGLMVAHSGTIMGLLTRPEDAATLLPVLETMANRYHPTHVYKEQYFSTGI